MKEIQLTQSQVALVDDEDFEWLSEFSWRALILKTGYVAAATTINRKTVLMHRIILKAEKGQLIDHKNRNSLDNRRENLRFCTHEQSVFNRGASRRKIVSKFKGVSKSKSGKFRARIEFRGRQKQVGTYASEIEAAQAYNIAAKELFGEFAFLNDV